MLRSIKAEYPTLWGIAASEEGKNLNMNAKARKAVWIKV